MLSSRTIILTVMLHNSPIIRVPQIYVQIYVQLDDMLLWQMRWPQQAIHLMTPQIFRINTVALVVAEGLAYSLTLWGWT